MTNTRPSPQRVQAGFTDLRDAALAYARAGYPIFPVRRLTKRPFTAHGFHDASTDEATVMEWWRDHPMANIGVPTGAPSGAFVLDIDPRHNGDKTLAGLEAKLGPESNFGKIIDMIMKGDRSPRLLGVEPLVARTGGGGAHFYFHHVPGVGISAGRLGQGLDIRGDGGFVIVPPSIHRRGWRYEWVNDNEIADAPDWLLGLLLAEPERPPLWERRRAVGRHSLDGLVRWILRDAVPGRRNGCLFWASCRAGELVATGQCDYHAAVACLTEAGRRVGLSESETRSTVESGVRAGRR